MTAAGGAIALLLSLARCARDRGVQAAGDDEGPGRQDRALAGPRRPCGTSTWSARWRRRKKSCVSAEVAGRVSRLVHDLGDRVARRHAAHRARFREAAVPRRRPARDARPGARALRRLGRRRAAAARPASPAVREHDARSSPTRSSSSIARRTSRPRNLLSRSGSRDGADAASTPRRRRTIRRWRRRGSCAPTSSRSPRALQLGAARAARRGHPRAVRRLRRRAAGLAGAVRPAASRRSCGSSGSQPLKLTAEVPEKFAPWIETGRAMAGESGRLPAAGVQPARSSGSRPAST